VNFTCLYYPIYINFWTFTDYLSSILHSSLYCLCILWNFCGRVLLIYCSSLAIFLSLSLLHLVQFIIQTNKSYSY
jgi:hypothetical protein